MLALAVPVGAVITLADDGGNGGTISTTTQTGSGTGGGMTGGGGSGTGGGMTGGGAALPTTMISSMDNMDGTISWTITFGAGIDISAVDEMQFSTSDNAPLTMFSRTGNMVTFVSTHTADGSITLDYTGTLAAMQTSTAVALTLPTTPQTAIDFLADVPTTATAAITGYSDTHPMISRSSAMDVTSVAIGDESYSFLAEPNAQGHLIASNGNLLIDKNEGTGMADGPGYLHFFTGTNIGETNQTFTAFDVVPFVSNPTPSSVSLGTATVGYSGTYAIMTLPTGDIDTGLIKGRFNMNINFGANNLAHFDGRALDSNNMTAGTFSAGSISAQNNEWVFSTMLFNGSGSLDGRNFTLVGGFVGTNAANGLYAADENGTQQTAGREAMTIVGERQASAHSF